MRAWGSIKGSFEVSLDSMRVPFKGPLKERGKVIFRIVNSRRV